MGVRTDDGCELWASATGAGEPVVLCHGGPGLWDMFGDLDLPARLVRWDQRGSGRSQRRGPYSTARTAADLDAVREHFGLDRMVLLGHSWGAQLALRYALDHPDRVTALGYVSGVGLGWDWREAFSANFEARLGDGFARWEELRGRARDEAEERELAVLQWSVEFVDPTTATAFAERMATPWFGVNHECNAAIDAEDRRTWREDELVEACRGLEVPTLIVDGAHDVRPRTAVDSLERALPNATRVVLDTGHVPWLEAPEEFTAACTRYLLRG
ncbi:alpha/beta fold hydrolase [Umezawaea tangerina]|uniref:Proline iminopeptidase n=1 Tax=Umezawaea tangerina TaxID=84725 RepID=A0A2T0SDY9_9PSEU|nr:alpha/beta hydrolase [Umezawaea tangerina]PRY31638.1 proline iminopeptidase [Umezawaea tangerina]